MRGAEHWGTRPGGGDGKTGTGLLHLGPATQEGYRQSAPLSAKIHRFYFEVHIVDSGPSGLNVKCGYNSGGTNVWFDCARGRAEAVGAAYAPLVASDGDVVGCGYDREAEKIFFSRNGLDLGRRHDTKPQFGFGASATAPPHAAVVGLGKGNRVAVNFGQQPFRFRPEERRRLVYARLSAAAAAAGVGGGAKLAARGGGGGAAKDGGGGGGGGWRRR